MYIGRWKGLQIEIEIDRPLLVFITGMQPWASEEGNTGS